MITNKPPVRDATIYTFNPIGPNSKNLVVTRKNLPRSHIIRAPPPQNVFHSNQEKVFVEPSPRKPVIRCQKTIEKKYLEKSVLDQLMVRKKIIEECSVLKGQVWLGKYLLKDTAEESKFKYLPLNEQ